MHQMSARQLSEHSLIKLIQDKCKSGIKTIDLGKMSARNPDSIRIGFPDPPDARFEALKGDLEVCSKYQSTKATTKFGTHSKRKNIWGEPKPQPDFADH